jgi:hypothetical protein
MCEENVPVVHGGRQKRQLYLPYESEMTLSFRFTGTGAGCSYDQATQAFP